MSFALMVVELMGRKLPALNPAAIIPADPIPAELSIVAAKGRKT
jgi:hypothetical protein